MTMSLLWNERCDDAIARGEKPYMYSAFCREHRAWAQRHDVRMRVEHKPAESIQVDQVGAIGGVVDPDTGEILRTVRSFTCRKRPYRSHRLFHFLVFSLKQVGYGDLETACDNVELVD